MSWTDFLQLLGSAIVTLVIGGAILYFIYQRLLAREEQEAKARRTPWITKMEFNREAEVATKNSSSSNSSSSTAGTLPQEVGEEIARRIAETPAHKALAAARETKKQEQASAVGAAAALEKKVDAVRRNIPLGASSQLVQKGMRLIEEGSHDEALVCFLALLYSAVENGHAHADRLPAHLAECLRGAGTCYRNLGQIEIASRFFQAERLLYEEMVAGISDMANGKKPGTAGADGGASPDKSRAIVASLFKETASGGADAEEGGDSASLPRRCKVLQEVAAQCMKYGYANVALSYELKNSALKRKATNKPMVAGTEEFERIAAVLRAVAEEKEHGGGAGASQAASAGAGAAAAAAASGTSA